MQQHPPFRLSSSSILTASPALVMFYWLIKFTSSNTGGFNKDYYLPCQFRTFPSCRRRLFSRRENSSKQHHHHRRHLLCRQRRHIACWNRSRSCGLTEIIIPSKYLFVSYLLLCLQSLRSLPLPVYIFATNGRPEPPRKHTSMHYDSSKLGSRHKSKPIKHKPRNENSGTLII